MDQLKCNFNIKSTYLNTYDIYSDNHHWIRFKLHYIYIYIYFNKYKVYISVRRIYVFQYLDL